MSSNEVKYCESCEEVTPQNPETAGARCKVCGRQNRYSVDQAMYTVSDEWIENFWNDQNQTIDEAEIVGSQSTIIIQFSDSDTLSTSKLCYLTL